MAARIIVEIGRGALFSECKPGAVLCLNQADDLSSFEIESTGVRDYAFGHPCLVLGPMLHEHVEICPILADTRGGKFVLQARATNASQMKSANDMDGRPVILQGQSDQSNWKNFPMPVILEPQKFNADSKALKREDDDLSALFHGGYVDLWNWGIVPHKMLRIITTHTDFTICRLDFESINAVRGAFKLTPLTQELYSCENETKVENGMNGVNWGMGL